MKLPVRLKTEALDLKNTLMALAFGKADDIKDIFEEVDENISLALRRRADGFLKYFKKTWLSETNSNFKPQDFSVYGHADRTNGHVESFHSRLHMKHPSLWIFFSTLSI